MKWTTFTLRDGTVLTLSDLDRVIIAALREPGEAKSAGEVGDVVRRAGFWNTSGRSCAVQGGGDYRAQMQLGRMRKRGLVEVRHGKNDGCSMWQLTQLGRKVLAS